MSLYEMLCVAHYRDSVAMMSLIGQFHPLLRKYARFLNREDSYNDLVADFIALIYDMKPDNFQNKSDGAVVSYLDQTIYHVYVKRLRHKINHIPEKSLSELSVEEQYILEARTSVEDEYFQYDIFDESKVLTSHERQILSLIYENNKSVTEIASLMGTSRQAVNQAKKRALHKLRHAVTENK